MNNLTKIKYLIAAVFLISLITSCEKADSEKDYGFPVIYMPQSTMFSGGLDNNYPVPGPNTRFPNYTINSATGKVDIVLGVYRAGTQALEEFTVDIYTRIDTATQIVNDGVIADASLLPEDLYTLPASVSVTSGNREAIFYLTLDAEKLKSNYSALAGKKLLLAVGIKNPTKFTLNQKLSTTIVVIDANSFLAPPAE
jgi:hypothetical protein